MGIIALGGLITLTGSQQTMPIEQKRLIDSVGQTTQDTLRKISAGQKSHMH